MSTPFLNSAHRCIPLVRGDKRPLESGWPEKGRPLNQALHDAPDGRVGYITGRGILVLDLDVKAGDPVDELKTLGISLEPTYCVRTPSAGWHPYFLVEEHFGQASPFEYADIRCDGGYVVAPPTDGYQVLHNGPIAPAPEGLLQALRQHRASKSALKFELPEGMSPEHLPAALDRLVARIQNINGQQERSLNGMSYLAGRYAGAGFLDIELASCALVEKGLDFTNFDPKNPWTRRAIEAKVTRGLSNGFEKPLIPPEAKSLIPDTRPSLNEARDALESTITEAIERGGNTLLQVDVGIGKTHAAIQAVKKLVAENPSVRILYAVPSHKLAIEIKDRMTGVGIEANVWHGMSRPDPFSPRHKMCRKDEEARLYQNTSHGMRETVGESAFGLQDLCDVCDFRACCGKKRQDAQFSNSNVGIITHALLATAPTDAACGVVLDEFEQKVRRVPDLLIVDESIDRAFVEALAFDPADRRINAQGQLESPGQIEYFMFGFDPALLNPPPKPTREFLEKVEKSRACSAYGYVAGKHFDMAERRHTSSAVPAVIGGEAPRIIRSKELDPNWGKTKLLLDATPDIDLVQAVLGPEERLDVKKIEAATPYVDTTWVYGSGLFAGGMTNAPKWCNRLRGIIEVEAGKTPSLLVIAPKRVLEAYMMDWEQIPENAECAHFGSLAGLDAYRDVATILVISHDIPPTPFARSYFELSQSRIAVNRAENCSALNHPDPDVAEYCKALVSRELAQAIGRGRGVSRTPGTPLRVIVVGNVEPTRLNRCLRLDEYVPHALDILAARGFVIKGNPGTKGYYPLVQALMPERFKNDEAVRTYFRSNGDRPYRGLLGRLPSERWAGYVLSVCSGRYNHTVCVDTKLDLEELASRFRLTVKKKVF